MPSFITAQSSWIAQHKALCSKFNIEVSSYRAKGFSTPSHDEFTQFLKSFAAFCEKNQGTTCNMLLLTGYHGTYGMFGTLNNLNQRQLRQLVQTAEKHKVKFKHILTDCCCAPFGLKELSGMLAHGGEAVGDRVTSTAFRMRDTLLEKMLYAEEQQSMDEEKLINSAVEEGINTFNAPIYIIKNDQRVTVIGTTAAEVKQHIIREYKKAGIVKNSLSDQDAEKELIKMRLGHDISMIRSDLKCSQGLFTVEEKSDRAELLYSRQQHQEQCAQVSKKSSIKNSYPYRNSGRIHFFKASSKYLNAEFHGLSGDYLKEKILHLFKSKLENTVSKKELDAIVKEFESSNEFKELKKGQGIITRLFGLKTSSIKAFEEMIQKQEQSLVPHYDSLVR